MSVNLLPGDCLQVLRSIPACSVQTCVTSPPYFGLRDYGTAKWEGGDPECDHVADLPATVSRASTLGPNKNGAGVTANQENAEWSRRQYRHTCPKCGAIRIDSQIGLEESPEQYIEKLVAVFREVKRVLKDDGTLWLNLGDSYAGSWGNYGGQNRGNGTQREIVNGSKVHQKSYDGLEKFRPPTTNPPGWKPKDLLMIPARVALALQADGWYLRSEIIWHKPNPMPESVRDRPTKAHEMIYLLAKSPRYFYDAEAVREPQKEQKTVGKQWRVDSLNGDLDGKILGREHNPHGGLATSINNPAGRNRRDVWTVVTRPYKDAHFATFPPALIEPCILAGTSERGECPKCGKAWVRVVEKSLTNTEGWGKATKDHHAEVQGSDAITRNGQGRAGDSVSITLGWRPSCSCVDESDHNGPFEPIPQTVLDPFNGSGTTGAVAVMHGRNYIGIELNPAYVELSQKRINGVQMEAAL